MKELLQFLERATNGKYMEYAINIPTFTVKERLAPAMEDFARIKFWLAGYYQTLRRIDTIKGLTLSPEARQDFAAVRAFLSQFDSKGGAASISDAKGTK